MEDAEEANLRAQVLGVGRDFEERRSAGVEEQAVEEALVLIGEWSQWVRQRKDHMNVTNGEEFLTPLGQPAVAGPSLALGAVPVSARVIRDGAIAAANASIAVAAQRGGAATLDGAQDLPLGPRQPGPTAFEQAFALGANDIGHLEGRPIHG